MVIPYRCAHQYVPFAVLFQVKDYEGDRTFQAIADFLDEETGVSVSVAI